MDIPSPSASTQGQGIRRPGIYLCEAQLYLWINQTTANHITVMFSQGSVAHPQTIKMTATQIPGKLQNHRGSGHSVSIWRVETHFGVRLVLEYR
jgi:hypothetical protein